MERVQLHLLSEFLHAGVDTTLVVGQLRGELIEQIPVGANVLEIAPRGPLLFLPRLVSLLKTHIPTHLISAADDVNCMALIANRLSGTKAKVMVTVHNTLSEQIRRATGIGRVKTLALRSMMRWLYPSAHSIVTVSSGAADDLARQLRLDRGRIRVIHNPVITRDFDALMRDDLPPTWPDGSAPVVIFVGRLHRQKRVDLLLSAFRTVSSRRDVRLVIAGDGPERGRIERRIRELDLMNTVTMTGFVSNPLPLMRASQVLVLPSDYEGFGNVLVEGLACGTAVVATDCPHGPAEILEGGMYGALIPAGDDTALAAAIEGALTGHSGITLTQRRSRALQFSTMSIASKYRQELLRSG